MAPPPLLALQGVTLTLGGKPLLDSADLSIAPGARLCLVGRNGSGKSTLLKIAAGDIEPDGGTRFLQPGASLRYLPQEPDFSGYATALAYVEAGLGPTDDPHVARTLLLDLGLTGEEDPARLSGGEARRAALARVLAPRPDILLLDEPTNHLDLPTILWLEEKLATSPLGAGAHQPRPTFSTGFDARDGVARSRPRAASGARLRRLRSLARPRNGRGRTPATQDRPHNRRRGTLAAPRRLRPAQAQRQAPRGIARDARRAAPAGHADGRGEARSGRGAALRQARHRGDRNRQVLWRTRHRR